MDSTIKLWDERQMKSEVESISFNSASVWDLKFNPNTKGDLKFAVSCIYDGYYFGKSNDSS